MYEEEPTSDDYYDSVELAAECIVEERERVEDPRPIEEAIFESADSSRWTFQTGLTSQTLVLSDREPQQWRAFVEEDDSWKQVLQAKAFTVFRQDLRNELEAIGVLD